MSKPVASAQPLAALLMRRAGAVAAAVAALALVLGVVRMNDDIAAEVDAAMTLAATLAGLARLGPGADHDALGELAALQASRPLRHLALTVQDADGRHLLDPPPEAPAPAGLRGLLALHRDWLSSPDARRVQWTVPRADGRAWTVILAASHDGERREAMVSLLGMLALLLLCIAGLLLAMRLNLARALAPLARLRAAIAGIERDEPGAVRALPAMPVAELDALAAALRHLADALARAEADRQRLARQVLTLQEDERARLARELHDELGQRLTAMRVDAAWLARRLAGQPEMLAVVEGVAAQSAQMQHDVRSLLARLQPMGLSAEGETETLGRLAELLHGLAAAWQRGDGVAFVVELRVRARDAQGRAVAGPADAAIARPLALALFRLTQEALTNVARHAQATRAEVGIDVDFGQHRIDWQVVDDGIGLQAAAADARGNGLAGMRERVWALGGTFELAPALAAGLRPGLRVSARFELDRDPGSTR